MFAPLSSTRSEVLTDRRFQVPTSHSDDEPPSNIFEDYPRVLHLASLVRTLILHPIDGLSYHAFDYEQATARHITMLVTWDAFTLFAQSMVLLSERPFTRLQSLEVNNTSYKTFQGHLLSRFISPSTTSLVTHCPVSQMGAVIYGRAFGNKITCSIAVHNTMASKLCII